MHRSNNQFVCTAIGTIKAKRASVKPCCFLLFLLFVVAGAFSVLGFLGSLQSLSLPSWRSQQGITEIRDLETSPFALPLSCLIIFLQVNFLILFKAGFEILNFAFLPSSQNCTHVFGIVLLCTLDGSPRFVYSDQLLDHRCRTPESDL